MTTVVGHLGKIIVRDFFGFSKEIKATPKKKPNKPGSKRFKISTSVCAHLQVPVMPQSVQQTQSLQVCQYSVASSHLFSVKLHGLLCHGWIDHYYDQWTLKVVHQQAQFTIGVNKYCVCLL